MVAAFSAPILSVAADAVRDLEGPDALFGLWTVFAKCKQSLPNGARLENITWRLWHCELKGPALEKTCLIAKESETTEVIGLYEKSTYLPPTPSASSTILPIQTLPAGPTQHSMASEDAVRSFCEVHTPPCYSISCPPCCPSENATRAVSSTRRIRATSRAVGRIICDFLPTNQDPSVDQPSSVDHPTDVSSWSFEGAATIYQSNPKTTLVARPSNIILPEVRSLLSCLPTPYVDPEPSISRTATQSPSQLLIAEPDAYPTPGLPSEPPRLVVVKPTPNPTPQPTPPTTPLVITTATTMQGNRSLWLTPLQLHRDSVSQPRYEGEISVGHPDHADICAQPMRNHDPCQDHADGLSVSSIASKSSECSHTTTTSMAGGSTTSASSAGYLYDEREKPSDLIGTTMGYTHLVGNLPLPTLQRLGSLSTIQSISTDRGRKEAVPSSDLGNAVKDGSPGSGMVTAVEEESEQELINKGRSSTGNRATLASKKRARRNTAPVSLTAIPCPHVDQSSHHSLAFPISTEHPTCSESTSERAINSNSVMNHEASYNRSPSPSRSRESSVQGSRSREHSGIFADLSGIGTLGGYTIAAAYPPPNMTVRKQVAVGAGKGRVKLAFGRGSGKSKAVRRNSAGSDVSAREKDRGANGNDAKLERVKSEERQQSRLEDILEKSTIDQRIEELQERPQVTPIHEEKVPQALMPPAAAKSSSSATAHALPKRYSELLTIVEPIQSVKRPPRFNIGSNSDDGSGVASKSAGSGSSQSGGHSIGQRAGKMMEGHEPHVMIKKKVDALLLEERERQRRAAKDEVQQLEVQQREHRNTHTEPSVPLHTTKQDIRHSKPTTHAVLERVQSPGRVSEKAKGRSKGVDHHHLVVPPPTSKQSSKTKSKSTPNLGSFDAGLAAKVRDSLGEPLLPKGRPVVVDNESEYETDGTWSDEEIIDETEVQKRIRQELAIQQERERQEAELQEELLLRQMYLQQQQQQQRIPPLHHQQHPGGRAAGVQRTHSSHYPAPNYARTNKGPQRNRHQQIRELALHHAKLEQAAKEAQRQREMVQKLPRESFQDLAKARANSVGLLSQLLKPTTEAPPPVHQHRRGCTLTHGIPPTTTAPCPPANLDTVAKGFPNNNKSSHQPTPAPQTEKTRPLPPRRHASTDERSRRMPPFSRITSPMRGPLLQVTKSSCALPVSSQVQVGSVIANGHPSAAITSSRILGNTFAMPGSGVYRPKGPPQGQEMEDDSDSEAENGKIQISKSLAEQRLKALAEKRGIRQYQAVAQPLVGPSKVAPPDEDVPDWARVSQPNRRQERQRRPVNDLHDTPLVRPPPSAPIPLSHTYKLPLPAPPTTPRTTRRQMLSTELSESLRRNLLWERQVSKNNLAAMRRSASGGANRHDGLGRLQPFTSIAPVVQLHAKGTIPLDEQEDPAKRSGPVTEAEREEMRRNAVARNRSWANEFHYAGW